MEHVIRNKIISALAEKEITLTTDKMGNLYAERIVSNELPTVLLCAHMDEAGFIVTDVTDDGYLKFDVIGEIEPINLISKTVKINEKVGLISLKAIHLTTKEERAKKIKTEDLFIDIGAKNKDEALNLVEIGDYASFNTVSADFGENSIKGKSLGSRIGCSMLVDFLKNNPEPNFNIKCLFYVQKEVSDRGIYAALNFIKKADFCLIIDSVKEEEDNKVVLGFLADTTDKTRNIYNNLKLLIDSDEAKIGILNKKSSGYSLSSKIPYTPIVQIGIPCRYINTQNEIVDKNSILYTSNTIKLILNEVKNIW